MGNLEQLYGEVSGQFNKLFKKQEEIQKRANELTEALEQAETDYDVDEVEKITVSLNSAKRVYDRINEDIKKLKIKVCGEDGRKLNRRLSEATDADHVLASEKARELFEKRNEYTEKLKQINDSIRTLSTESYLDRGNMIHKFKPFMPKNVDPRALNLMELTDVTDED